MKELNLFTGGGGGLLASVLLGWTTIGAVEIDEYCCKALDQRQRDGCLEKFPIWNMDVREFNRRVASRYRGVVDVVSAGFPCQPFSSAGKQKGADDARNMWPATIDCIRIVRPRFAFLENVVGLVSAGYLATILGDLAESLYDAEGGVLGADDCGAPHRRKRLWIVGRDTHRVNEHQVKKIRGRSPIDPSRVCSNVPEQIQHTADEFSNWWAVEPDVDRVVNGLAHRVDRLKTIGNGQVPIVATTVFALLMKSN